MHRLTAWTHIDGEMTLRVSATHGDEVCARQIVGGCCHPRGRSPDFLHLPSSLWIVPSLAQHLPSLNSDAGKTSQVSLPEG